MNSFDMLWFTRVCPTLSPRSAIVSLDRVSPALDRHASFPSTPFSLAFAARVRISYRLTGTRYGIEYLRA